MSNDIERHQIVLAALLHDIGKFWQRADVNNMRNSQHLSATTKQLEGAVCPLHRNGYYTHKHVLWTAQFFESFRSQLSCVFDSNNEGEKQQENVMRLSASHHHPNTDMEQLIQLADWLSSGVDRTNDPDSQKEVEDEKTWESFKKTKMRSIFEFLSHEDVSPQYLLPLRAQDLTENQFPDHEVAGGDYNSLWDAFAEDIKCIETDSPVVLIETMTYLLHKYTSTIPSSTVHLPDVSLYDHLKSTAAIADCLYVYQKDAGGFDKNIKNDQNQYPFLLIGGDVSGIQSFIYDIVSKFAAKNLKGRSFYVQLLVQSFVQTILNELGMTSVNVIYSSGGGFYILGPNTPKNLKLLDSLEQNFQKNIFKEFGTSLYIALDSTPMNCADFFDQKISERWQELSEKLNRKKRQKYKNIIQGKYASFFEAQANTGGDMAVDFITGENLLDGAVQLEDSENKINRSTQQQIELGKILRSSDYWIITTENINYGNWKNKSFDPADLGVKHYFVSKEDVHKEQARLKGSFDSRKVMVLNDTNFMATSVRGINNIYGFEYYGGNDFPCDRDGSPMTFDELAEIGEGISRLGVLRMDVDNLGQIFINGIDERKRTFSRYSTLSRNLDWFFKGYLNTIWHNKYNASTQIIYSGGDDLFIIGFWSDLIEMAERIHSEFRRWVCFNPHITLSGGIAIVPGKYPILKAATEAEKAEKNAKNYRRNSKGGVIEKNAFSLFGYALSWDEEFPAVKEWKNKIKKHIQNGMPSSFLSKVMAHYHSVDTFSPELSPLRVMWMTSYDFQRLKDGLKDAEMKEFVEECKKGIYQNRFGDFDCATQSNYHFLELLYLACRWADYEMRD